MFSDRSRARVGALAGALALACGILLGGCGGGDSDSNSAATTSKGAKTTTTAAAKPAKPSGTSDRGARRCTKSAFLAALLADVAPQPYTVSEVRCAGDFARSRFVLSNCAAGQASVACGSAKVAAWRLGSKRWRLIAYSDGLSCAGVREKAKDYPSTLCD